MPLRKYVGYAWNRISLAGVILAATATCLIIGFLTFEGLTGVENPYFGLMTYFLFPGMLILGLLLIPIGAYLVREKLRTETEEEIAAFPHVDFNDKHKRLLFGFFVVSSFFFVLLVSVASLKGFEFTESTVFCGKLCHVVMEPEHTAWNNSPHAKVKCVECHVGPGASWYVKAKLSGLRQLYAVLSHTYPETIETPIDNLRPARDTCEHCHWPEKFYAGRQKVFLHYAPNRANTPREINMLINVGAPATSVHTKGIHWHIGSKVNFIATDKKRLHIPYVQVVSKDGSVTEYLDSEKQLSKAEIQNGKKREMDCTDCHNRPTHIYRAPGVEIDEHFFSGALDPTLPYLKKVALKILTTPYNSSEQGRETIARQLPLYYATNYPEVAREKKAQIAKAVVEIQEIYGRNFFPSMKVSWNTYPNYIGHFYTPGCFRCHDGKHKSVEGKIISKNCKLCHTVLSQTQENIPAGTKTTEFVHPVDLGDELMKTNCSECHAAGGHEGQGGQLHTKI